MQLLGGHAELEEALKRKSSALPTVIDRRQPGIHMKFYLSAECLYPVKALGNQQRQDLEIPT
jgi:hypothetical protein